MEMISSKHLLVGLCICEWYVRFCLLILDSELTRLTHPLIVILRGARFTGVQEFFQHSDFFISAHNL